VSALAQQTPLGARVLTHLDAQLQSARRLLDLVLQQGHAIRRRDVEGVLTLLTHVQGEMERRGQMERERTALLQGAAGHLGIPAHAVTLEAMASLFTAPEAQLAAQRSAELRGLLAEIAREHAINRALMKQELAFLDHLTRLLGGGDEQPGYSATGGTFARTAPLTPRAPALRALDLEA
jgi:flagellar biosynthesis/type III secretory pathway chaperone